MSFTNVAWAMGAAGQQGQAADPIMSFMPLVLMFAIFYFLLIRPQQKKAKEHKELLNNLKAGDRVITAGGLIGVITKAEENELFVELAEKTVVCVGRQFVSGLYVPVKSAKKEKKGKK